MFKVGVIAAIIILVIAASYGTMTKDRRLAEHFEENYQTLTLTANLILPVDKFAVYLINLERKPDRLARFQRAYAQTDLSKLKPFTRIDAVDGKKIDIRHHVSSQAWKEIQDIEWFGYRIRHNQLTVGAVGCYLSHLKVYEALRRSTYDYAIIFEDDVRFVTPNLYQQIAYNIELLPNTWDIMLLGCVCLVCNNHQKYQDMKHFFLMHAYVIKRSSAEKLLAELEYMPIRQQIDSELSTMVFANKLKVFCLNKHLVVQDSANNTTTIQVPLKVIEGVNPYDIPHA
jgi:GR25 family glycosyltransferase involved in LPS biosynthesis